METWAWLLAYVVGFGLLQVALYHYFRRNDATPDSGAAGDATAGNAAEGSRDGDDPAVYCQHCGARNASVRTVRYCRECVHPLG